MNSPLILHDRSDDQTLLTFTTAEACMTADPMIVEPNTPAVQAALLLKTYKFGALPVVHEGRLVGIVTVSDILDSYMTLLNAQEKEVRP
jgi:acetoin utilization protein AcuB